MGSFRIDFVRSDGEVPEVVVGQKHGAAFAPALEVVDVLVSRHHGARASAGRQNGHLLFEAEFLERVDHGCEEVAAVIRVGLEV